MEIGSDFWIEDNKIEQQKVKNNNEIAYLLSGRTAIDCALQLIEENKKVNKVYFPSYCCQSMIDPFVDRKIDIDFYTVSFKNGSLIYDIDCKKECDIFFAMNYFGFSQYGMASYIEEFKSRKVCVIEDMTHSLLSKRKYSKNSDFVVASLRKWFPIMCGGVLINNTDKHLDTSKLQDNNYYTNLKEHAMIEKKKYISNEKQNNKGQFLKEFARTEQILNEDYKNYKIDQKSYSILKNIDIEEVINKRRRNAEIIYKYLRKQNDIRYLENINLKEDTPLFVPVFLNNQKRNELKQYLIENKVYCPNHWGIPKEINNTKQKEIYNAELSLICDQRYGKEEMMKILKLLKSKEMSDGRKNN